MSLIKSIMHQLGLSGDPAKNFTLSVPAAPDGTMKLARGNAGATTQDIMTVDAAGRVAFPQNAVLNSGAMFRGSVNVSGITVNSDARVAMKTNWTELFDLDSSFDPATGKFQPKVAGYYSLTVVAAVGDTPINFVAAGYMLNQDVTMQNLASALTPAPAENDYLSTTGTNIIYFNGTTDFCYFAGRWRQNNAAPISLINGGFQATAYLVRTP